MARQRTVYVCRQCGRQQPLWSGKCPDCGEWNSLIEEPLKPTRRDAGGGGGGEAPTPILAVKPSHAPRLKSGIGELDRILGGGVVVGSVTLVGGDPGIGKSTLLLQLSDIVARQEGRSALYVTAEESALQTRLRAERLGVKAERLFLLCETNLEAVKAHAVKLAPSLVVIDSIQTINSSNIPSAAGSVTQVRECAADLIRLAKGQGMSLFLIGHVTKDGAIAGPRTLEHLVDTVLYFEGDRYQAYRVLRAVKNRFGSTNEVGIFEMTAAGLREVENPAAYFLSRSELTVPGTVIVPALVGSRSLLVEIQALTARATYGIPTRRVTGVDFNRVCMLLAVLERRAGLALGMQDVFVNVVGGVTVDEPASDLGIAVAIASSFRSKAAPPKCIFCGEVGLGGEIRGVTQLSARLAEAARLGFERAYVSRENLKGLETPVGLEVVALDTVNAAVQLLGDS